MLKRTLLALPLVALLSSSLLAGCDDKKETAYDFDVYYSDSIGVDLFTADLICIL